MTVPILAVTSGEQAGIGRDICLDLPEADLPCRCVVLGDKTLLQARAQALGKSVQLQDYDAARAPAAGVLEVLHIPLRAPCEAGRLSTENAPYVLQLLDRAYEGVQAGEFAALVTAPLHKGILNDAGIAFTGHTEYLAEKSGTGQVVMMLAGGGLRVALATTHLPLKDIAAAIGHPQAHRAVGTAVGRNPISFLIPCHRALRRDGGLGGYHWGLPRKRAMLAWEAARTEL